MTQSVILRICACGCGRQFHVDLRRPGREYCYGHKKRAQGVLSPETPQPSMPRAHQSQERHLLDYRLARKTAQKEIAKLEGAIDRLDDEMQEMRGAITSRQVKKDELVARHGRVRLALLHLSAAIDDVDAQTED
jgi:hypothetical protein